MAGTPLLDEASYLNGHLNPSENVPEYALRQVYKRIGHKGVVPLACLQALCDAGYTRTQTFAAAFGATREVAEREMVAMNEIANNLSARPATRRAELGFLLTVWEELRGRAKALTELQHKNLNTSEPVTIEIDREVKVAIMNTYRKSVHEQYYPLVPTTTPHFDFWDLASTRRDKYGYMTFFYVQECRHANEKLYKADKMSLNMERLIQLGTEIDFWKNVSETDEITMRRWLYWMTAYFLGEAELEACLTYQNKVREWIRLTHPPASAVKYADEHAVGEMCNRVRDGKNLSFQEALEHVTENLRNYHVDAMLNATGTNRGEVELGNSAVIRAGGTCARIPGEPSGADSVHCPLRY